MEKDQETIESARTKRVMLGRANALAEFLGMDTEKVEAKDLENRLVDLLTDAAHLADICDFTLDPAEVGKQASSAYTQEKCLSSVRYVPAGPA